MPQVSLDLPIPNAAQLVATYDRVVIYRSMGSGQPFVEVTTPQTRPVLSGDTVCYSFTDQNGAAGYLYAAGLINSLSGATGPMGQPVAGSGDPALSVLSVADLKTRYLFGLPLTNRQRVPLPDSVFEFAIRSAVASMERQLDIAISQQVITGEAHTYNNPLAENKAIVIYTHKVPVQSVQSVYFQLPYFQAPQQVPTEWITLEKDFGSIYLYPQSSLMVFAVPALALTYGNMALDDYFPNGWVVDYVAGFPAGQVPADIIDAIGMMASLQPLSILGDLILPPGVASTSFGIDGLSQSISGKGGYADRINQYLQALPMAIKQLTMTYRGTRLQGG